ncbi:MAG: DUF4340 domain-containing protein [bacterium]|jgi:hypothetical protein
MLNKNRTLLLLIILVLVLVVYFALDQFSNSESNFRTNLPAFDTAAINHLEISSGESGNAFQLRKEDGKWFVMTAGQRYAADPFAASAMLGGLNGTAIRHVAGTSSSQWPEFLVTDSTGTRIKFMDDDHTVNDIIVGRFEYIQPKSQVPDQFGRRPQGEMISYLRISGEETVYAVDGMIALGLGKKPDDFRNKEMLKFNKDKLQELSINYRDGRSLKFSNTGQSWMLNGQAADSAAMAKYLARLSNLRGKHFARTEPAGEDLYVELKLVTNGESPIILKAYRRDTSRYIITTSQNPTNKFLEEDEFVKPVFVQAGDFAP